MANSQRLTAPQRRAAIIAAAIKLFAERGFRGATTRELASAVGVSEPVLYQHFPSKRDLYTAIIESTMDETKKRVHSLGATGTPQEFFRGLGQAILQFHEENPDYIRLLLYSALEKHELAQIFHERFGAPYFEFIGNYIRNRIADGAFKDCDPILAARAFVGMVADVAKQQVLHQCNESAGERTQIVEQMVDIFLTGISK